MKTNSNRSSKENRGPLTSKTLLRLAGVSAAVSGVSGIVVGLFHQVNAPASVATATWVNVHIFAVLMGFFGLFGMAGIYARQVERAGWLGLAGFLMVSFWLGIIFPFSFIEAFFLPNLAPDYVAAFVGMFSGGVGQVDLGFLPVIWNVSGPMLILGQLLFGITTFRAAVLPRWAGALMAAGAVLVPAGAALPAELESLVLVPLGLSLGWMGIALLSGRHAPATDIQLDGRTAEFTPAKTA